MSPFSNASKVQLIRRIMNLEDEALVQKILKYLKAQGDEVGEGEVKTSALQSIFFESALRAEEDIKNGNLHSQSKISEWVKAKAENV